MTIRVLICDDSSMARKQMARALPKNWKADVTFAFDGRHGLERLKETGSELLFLDLNMPEMDGYQVLKAIREQDLPVLTIVVSGDIQPEARERVRKLGAIDFIKKPTDTDQVARILRDYGFLQPDEFETGKARPGPTPPEPTPVSLPDYLQEISNVAMGRSSDLLARLLKVFVKQPIPRVEMITTSELSMAISAADTHTRYSAVCQGFLGAGIAGEAMLLFADANFDEMAKLLMYEEGTTENLQVEVLMDMSSILFGAFINGISDQLDIKLRLGHPTVLGQHRKVGDLLDYHRSKQEKLLCIEIGYELENTNISCDMLILLTEDSVPFLKQRLKYLVD
ncbi:response regulator [Marinobacter confluentis]|uniref:Response regulator n=1 Tax=Marinobacter confluentis TaxID=1697557 RepID=A0A4Z1BQF9_9GAMM|nr:response regulator [Marinobacter confluentis]TGN39915.1 response regulator [Marinobacter confluentis]